MYIIDQTVKNLRRFGIRTISHFIYIRLNKHLYYIDQGTLKIQVENYSHKWG